MRLLESRELDLILTHSTIEECLMIQVEENVWTFVLYVRNHNDGTMLECQLVSRRGRKREWSDPRLMLRFLRLHYDIRRGHFQLVMSC